MHHENLDSAEPGDNVGFLVENLPANIRRGHVASNSNDCPAIECEFFTAQVVIMDHPGEIKPGYCPILDCCTAHVACKWKELIAKIDRRSGKTVEDSPKFLKKTDAGIVKMYPCKPMCVETLADCAPLGRFTVRDSRTTVAVGFIQSVEKKAI